MGGWDFLNFNIISIKFNNFTDIIEFEQKLPFWASRYLIVTENIPSAEINNIW